MSEATFILTDMTTPPGAAAVDFTHGNLEDQHTPLYTVFNGRRPSSHSPTSLQGKEGGRNAWLSGRKRKSRGKRRGLVTLRAEQLLRGVSQYGSEI